MKLIKNHKSHRNLSRFASTGLNLLFMISIIFILQTSESAILAGQITTRQEQINRSLMIKSLDFPGGTVADYLKMLQRDMPDVNIIIMSDVDKIMMPAIRLKSVSISSAVELLQGQTGQDSAFTYSINIDQSNNRGNSHPLFVIRTKKRQTGQYTTSSMVWTVEPLLQTMSSDDIMAAIDVALPLAVDGKPNIELRFHEETGLLIAKGGEEELSMIDQVLQQLGKTTTFRKENEERERRIDELENHNTEMRQELEKANAQRDEFNRRAEGIKARAEEEERIIVELRETLKKKDQSLENRKSDSTYLQNTIKELQDEIVKLQKQLRERQNKP